MANQEHLDILLQGVEAWNRWREKNPEMQPDLSRINLGGANLSEVNFSKTNLSFTFLHHANLDHANLNNAKLYLTIFANASLMAADLSSTDMSGAVLSCAILMGANLRHAYLLEANLSFANFFEADLSGANLLVSTLIGANFTRAKLFNTDFSGVQIGWTTFGDIDFRNVKGLNTVTDCSGPFTIGIDTIVRSQGNIPTALLRTSGAPDSIITYIHSLVNHPAEYYSCFISYSNKDKKFVKSLHDDLQSNGVRCWFAPEDLKIGEKFWRRIDESIQQYDKLLVVLSQHSVNSVWVENEVMTALEKERQQNKLVLFPIKLDETVLETNLPWAANLRRARHIGDFTKQESQEDYQKALTRLLRDLKLTN